MTEKAGKVKTAVHWKRDAGVYDKNCGMDDGTFV